MKRAQDITGEARELLTVIYEAAAEQGIAAVWPVWADGGDGKETSHFKPPRHIIAAWPREVQTPQPAVLRVVGLASWLRQNLVARPEGCDEGPLQVIALSYDAGLLFDEATRDLWRAPEGGEPSAVIATYDAWLEAETPEGPWRAFGDADHPLLSCLRHRVQRAAAGAVERSRTSEPQLRSERDDSRWQEGFEAIIAGLEAGDFYQVNLARRLVAALPRQTQTERMWFAFQLFLALRGAQPTSFGALFPLTTNHWLVSGSPESLLTWAEAGRTAATWPIKGTHARTSAADSHDAEALRASTKDQAEHTMIVDLMRNDLGRVAVHGSVAVSQLMAALPLATLHHLVSEVRCRVRDDCDLVSILEAIFPGGSITGAPRVAAMRAIARLEGFDRGFYCGTLGISIPGRGASFSILIRTSLVGPETLSYAVGGGIVVDSRADAEWDETEHKAAGLRRALADLLI